MYDFQNNTIKKLEKLTDCTTLIGFFTRANDDNKFKNYLSPFIK
jgi:hypothetical protein